MWDEGEKVCGEGWGEGDSRVMFSSWLSVADCMQKISKL